MRDFSDMKNTKKHEFCPLCKSLLILDPKKTFDRYNCSKCSYELKIPKEKLFNNKDLLFDNNIEDEII